MSIEQRLPIYEEMYRNGHSISAQLLEDLRTLLAQREGRRTLDAIAKKIEHTGIQGVDKILQTPTGIAGAHTE